MRAVEWKTDAVSLRERITSEGEPTIVNGALTGKRFVGDRGAQLIYRTKRTTVAIALTHDEVRRLAVAAGIISE